MIDWGLGRYEETAAALEPAGRAVVDLAAIVPGERVLDLGCGTGNAALAAARTGGVVTGVDRAQRLVEVARSRAAADGAAVTFDLGDAQELPYADGAFDVVVSVFALIFVQDPSRAIAEALRVLAPGGRAYISAWLPSGPVHAMASVFVRAAGVPEGGFPWHDTEAVAGLARPLGARVRSHERSISFTSASPEAFLEEGRSNPLSVALASQLERAGIADRAAAEALQVLREQNEDPSAFRATSPYVVHELRQG